MMKDPGLQVQLNFKTLIVFIFFFFLMHELHELAHIITGRLVCGCWGSRDLNVWHLCANCSQLHPWPVIATFVGPVFTFMMLWVGWYLIKCGRKITHRSLGLVLILGNMQFGRIYMAAMGSGDEMTGMRALFLSPDHPNALVIKLITVAIVTIICLPPLIAAHRAISNKRRLLIFAAFLILPLMLDTVVILILLNSLLAKGILDQVWIMGTPLFITIWCTLCIAIVAAYIKRLTGFAKCHAYEHDA